jgi:hypothetical protein
MKRRTRRGLLASAVFILAGIGGAVGGHVTDKLTPAAVWFAVLLALGGFVALILDRASDRKETTNTPDDRAAPSVDARGAGAVQVGDHNLQINQKELPETRGR